ncbi:MAG TPA: NAD+ kinase [Verrucomicrobiae bacterium]|nr:NAD+ kinase [Verrucomicrobiae bacterium]
MVDRFVIVTKRTRLEELVDEYSTEGAAAFTLEMAGDSISRYQREHQQYQRSLDAIYRQLPTDAGVVTVSRSDLPTFLFREKDLVIVCGPDGLFVNLAQYLGDQLVLGINPDPRTIAGNLMPFAAEEVGDVIGRLASGKGRVEELPFVRAATDEQHVVWGINDIFVGRLDHVSARYKISFQGREEHHSSSGVIISTGVGSQAWLRSIVTMVEALTDSRDHLLADLPGITDPELVFVVREPFPSPQTGAYIVTGRVVNDRPLQLTCEMPKGGVFFSDGMVDQAMEWPAGSTLTVSVGERVVRRLVRG